MDGMAKRKRTTAGDELSEKLVGVGAAGADRVAAGEEAVSIPASTAERMPTTVNGDM